MKAFDKQAKALLMGTNYLRQILLNLCWRENKEDPEYPSSFWRVVYQYQYEKHPWELVHQFDADTLEEAIAHSILGTHSEYCGNNMHKTIQLPENLTHWKPYKISVTEHINRKQQWGELNEHKHTSINYEIRLNTGRWVKDYSEGARNLETALCFVPKMYWEIYEGSVPYHWDYRNTDEEHPSHELYPIFKYDGHYFKSNYYIPDQKCICGESETYYNTYEHDNSVKVEVWRARCFEKNIIHFDGTHIIYNDSVIALTEDERDKYSGFISSDDMDILRKRYPEAEGYDGDMESRNFPK